MKVMGTASLHPIHCGISPFMYPSSSSLNPFIARISRISSFTFRISWLLIVPPLAKVSPLEFAIGRILPHWFSPPFGYICHQGADFLRWIAGNIASPAGILWVSLIVTGAVSMVMIWPPVNRSLSSCVLTCGAWDIFALFLASTMLSIRRFWRIPSTTPPSTWAPLLVFVSGGGIPFDGILLCFVNGWCHFGRVSCHLGMFGNSVSTFFGPQLSLSRVLSFAHSIITRLYILDNYSPREDNFISHRNFSAHSI